MIPEPDYSDEEAETRRPSPPVEWNHKFKLTKKAVTRGDDTNRVDERGLILPKKLINPCQESSDKKSLHKELMFNKKVGIDVLNKKTELQKALEKHKEKVAQKDEKNKEVPLTPLQKAIEERAQRIDKINKEVEEKEEKEEDDTKTDFKKAKDKFNVVKKP